MWEPEVIIGDSRPWPDAMHAVRGRTGERQRYVPERTCSFKTIEQFIASKRSRGDICECTKCGYRCARGFIVDEHFLHCPSCGARVEGVDE